MLLTPITHHIWHVQARFIVDGVTTSSRLTVVKLKSGDLWLHSPTPFHPELIAELNALGPIKYLISPNKKHYLFLGSYIRHLPNTEVWGPSGLVNKIAMLTEVHILEAQSPPSWAEDLIQIPILGVPAIEETVWWHKDSETLILTDLCQWWSKPLPLSAKIYAYVQGLHKEMVVPKYWDKHCVDKQAFRQSLEQILSLNINRIILGHNSIIEDNAHAKLQRAFARFRLNA